jgi:two-component system sensor histidine kinase DegS
MTIQDDGIGFQSRSVARRRSGGLLGMRERAELLNGNLRVVSSPDAGTRIELEIASRTEERASRPGKR